MVRTAFLTFLLITFVAITASAARIVPTRPRAHATISKSAQHRSRSSLHPASTNARNRPVHSSGTTSAHRTTTGGHTRAASHTMYRTRSSAGHPATFRRTRYNPYRSKAHFVPLAASIRETNFGRTGRPAATAIDSAQSVCCQAQRPATIQSLTRAQRRVRWNPQAKEALYPEKPTPCRLPAPIHPYHGRSRKPACRATRIPPSHLRGFRPDRRTQPPATLHRPRLQLYAPRHPRFPCPPERSL